MKLSIFANLAIAVSALPSGLTAPGVGNQNITVRNGPKDSRANRFWIPTAEVGCTGFTVKHEDSLNAKELLYSWWEHGNWVNPYGWRNERVGTAVWWLCNCKGRHDLIPADEIDEAYRLINEHCGLDHTGWVYSRQWAKSWNVGEIHNINTRGGHDLCPKNCIMWFNDVQIG